MTDKKPKGAKTAYIFFTMEFREQMKKANPNKDIVFADVSKDASEKWKVMAAKEKQKYVDMAAKDKERHLKELENYEATTPTEKPNKKNKRKTKDPNEPKRPWSSYFFFCDEFRNQVKSENPEFKVGDIAKSLGKMWADLKDKSKYEKMNEKAKEKYNQDIEIFKTGSAPASKKSKTVVETHDNEDEEEQEEDDSAIDESD